MEKIKVLIAEMNREYYIKLKNDIEQDSNIEVVARENDGEETFQAILLYKPDVIIMDNLLNMCDGMAVLENLRYTKLFKEIVTIVLSSIYSEKIKNMLLVRGAKYVSDKNYDKEELICMIKKLYNENQNKLMYERRTNSHINTKQENLDIQIHIREMLKSIGMTANHRGYRYLKEAMLIKVENKDMETKEILKKVAKRFLITDKLVYSSIRELVIKSFERKQRPLSIQFILQ